MLGNVYLGLLQTDEELYLYHSVYNKQNYATKLLNEYGVCSPEDIYALDKELFHKRVFDNYQERAKAFLHKTSVTDEDVLDFLNRGRLPLTAKCIFFAFDTDESLGLQHSDIIQLKIPMSVIEKYVVDKPIKVLGKKFTPITLKELKDNLFKLQRQAIEGSKKNNSNALKYKYIVHCGIPMNPIPLSECEILW